MRVISIVLILAILFLIGVSSVSAVDTSDWKEITVNNVDFNLPPKYQPNDSEYKYSQNYFHGSPYDFKIKSMTLYKNLADEYGMWSTSKDARDIEETNIEGHDAIIIYEYNKYFDRTELHLFFSTGEKIFYMNYQKDNVTPELKEIIKSTPKSKMSYETFMDKLNNAQKDYLDEELQINLELDAENYYRDYNNHLNNFRYGPLYPDY